MERLNVVAFTHNNLTLSELGKFHIPPDRVCATMRRIRSQLKLSEIVYLSTCNRVEVIIVGEEGFQNQTALIKLLAPSLKRDEVKLFAEKSRMWTGINAVNHLVEVASSMDSMVIGEREIITQLRMAYEKAAGQKLTGDFIRLVIRHCIETAKLIYTETGIARKPVSVVTLAFQKLMESDVDKNSKFLVIGSGTTNMAMCQMLKEYGFRNIWIYNRSPEHASLLAQKCGGVGRPLSEIERHAEGFDVLITCTSAHRPIVTEELYRILSGNKNTSNILVDLAVPGDIHPAVVRKYTPRYISVQSLKPAAEKNLHGRKKELLAARKLIYESLEKFKQIFRTRQIELELQDLPDKVGAIRTKAVEQVFARDIRKMDETSRATLEKVLNYMEKKYVSVPMVVAKKLAEQHQGE